MEQEILEILRSMQNDIKNMQSDIKRMDLKIDKNTILLEELKGKVETIAEVQTAHKEQSEFGFKNTDALIEDKSDLLAGSLKNVSKDVKDTKESIEVLKEMTGKHEVEINILKRRPV